MSTDVVLIFALNSPLFLFMYLAAGSGWIYVLCGGSLILLIIFF